MQGLMKRKKVIIACETLDMVVRYTKSVKFEDSLKMYQKAM